MYSYVKIEKMRPVEAIPGIGGREINENDGGDEFN
jgi:hypothetical protein